MSSYMPIGHRVIRLDAVDSTNNYAANGIARGEFGHGTAIMALEQSAGKGQRGRTWTTAKGLDLAVSIVLQPQGMPATAQFDLAKLASLAVHRVVARILEEAGADGNEVRIKWPNDVLVGREKIAGILIVNEVQGERLVASVVGIGLNVNGSGWPSELHATSLCAETGAALELEAVLHQLCSSMEHFWQLHLHEPGVLNEAYTGLLWAKGRFTAFTLDGQDVQGRPLGVDGLGRLLLEDGSGQVSAYGLERVRFKR